MSEKEYNIHSKFSNKMTSNDLTKHERILKSATELFILKGYANAATDEIAKSAEVSKGLIFHYFRSKDDLALEVLKHLVQIDMGLDKFFEGASYKNEPNSFLRKFVTETLNEMQLNPGFSLLFMDLLINVKNPEINQDIKTYLAGYITSLVNLFRTMGFYNPELKARTLYAIVDGLAFQFLFMKGEQTELTTNDFVDEIMLILEK